MVQRSVLMPEKFGKCKPRGGSFTRFFEFKGSYFERDSCLFYWGMMLQTSR